MKKKTLLLFLLSFATYYIAISQTYVSTTGSDVSGTGSSTNPYATVQKGVDMTAARGTVLVAAGNYLLTNRINITKPITVKKIGNGEAILNGQNLTFSLLNPYMMAIVSTYDVTLDSLSFKNGIYEGAKGLWILNNTTNPLKSRNITVKNCTFNNIGWRSNNLTDLPPNNTYAANAIRIEGQISSPMSAIFILNNTISNCATGWGEALTVTGNVDTFLIENNTVHHIANIGIEIAGNYFTNSPTSLNQARNGIIRLNKVYNCMSGIATSAGIYLDGSINCTVERNEVFQNGAGISIGAEVPIPSGVTVGKHKVFNNISYKNAIAGMYCGSGTFANFIKGCSVYNNTFYKNVTGELVNGITTIDGTPVLSVADGSAGDILLFNSDSTTFQNNIIYPLINRKAFVGMGNKQVIQFSSKYNLFFHDDATPLFYMYQFNLNGLNGTNTFNTISNYNTITGLEANSIFGNPQFVNESVNNFRLTPCSIGLDKGNPLYNNLLSGSIDFDGNTRRYNNVLVDCGAYEYQAIINPCTFTLSPLSTQCQGATSQIKLTWTNSAQATSYDIYRNGNLYVSNLTDTQYLDITVSSGVTYSYFIKAKNINYNSNSNNSNGTLSITTNNCQQPNSFSIVNLITECVGVIAQNKLSWSTSTNATSYDVYRNGVLYSSNITTTQFVDMAVIGGNVYSYYVKAKNTNSNLSVNNLNGELSITTYNCSAPELFTLLPITTKCEGTKSQLILNWTSAKNATSYDIYRNDTLYKTNNTTTTFIDTVLTFGRNYTYFITAKNSNSATFANNINGKLSTVTLNCSTTTNPTDSFDLKVYPNPSNGNFTVFAKKTLDKNIEIKIFNSLGQLVYVHEEKIATTTYSKFINIKRNGRGVYYMTITIGNKTSTIKIDYL